MSWNLVMSGLNMNGTSISHLFILTGASRGMGRALAEQLLQPGHRLLTLSRHVRGDLSAKAHAAGAELTQWSVDLSDGISASEQMLLHVDLQGPKSAVFGEASLALLGEAFEAQRHQPAAEYAGRRIALRG